MHVQVHRMSYTLAIPTNQIGIFTGDNRTNTSMQCYTCHQPVDKNIFLLVTLFNDEVAEHPYTPFVLGKNGSKAITSVFLVVVGSREVAFNTDTLTPLPVLRTPPSTVACMVKSPGLSTTHSIEKFAPDCMLNLLLLPSIAVREEWSAAKGGDVRSVTSVRDPAKRT